MSTQRQRATVTVVCTPGGVPWQFPIDGACARALVECPAAWVQLLSGALNVQGISLDQITCVSMTSMTAKGPATTHLKHTARSAP